MRGAYLCPCLAAALQPPRPLAVTLALREHGHLSFIRENNRRDDADERGFARAVRTRHTEDLARPLLVPGYNEHEGPPAVRPGRIVYRIVCLLDAGRLARNRPRE